MTPGELLDPEHAEIGDGESAALELVRLELLRFGAFGKRFDLV